MVEGNIFNIPLSPPTSPRLSSYHAEASQPSWQEQHKNPLEVTPDSADDTMALVHTEMPTIDLNLDRSKPLLRTHKTFPYTLRTSGLGADLTDPALEDHSPTSANTSNGLVEPVQANDMVTLNFGGSAPASPISNLTPVSPHKDSLDDITSQDLGLDDDDLMEEKPDRPMTAAEIRNQKRKMKRFRLTHSQTRFLMSEFARQAHPDAAHRERLAREIPGLSPRQVQVWFQNRRAKLKRLTSDDRERMMRSRALPDDFDMTQALQNPFGPGHSVGGSLSTPTSYAATFPEGNMIRPLNLDSLRRVPDTTHSSPAGGFAPTFAGSFFTPPQSVTDTLSPVSPAGDSPFAYSPTLDGSPRRGNPFAGSPSQFTSHPSIPRLGHLHERREQSLTSSPLLGGSDQSNGMMPYGLGLTYPNMSSFTQPPSSRMRSFSNNNQMRPRIELSNTSFAPNRTAPTPQSATFPPFTSSPLQTSYSMLSAPHNVTSFPSAYMRQEPSPTSEPFPTSDFKLGGDHDDDDGHNAVSAMPSF